MTLLIKNWSRFACFIWSYHIFVNLTKGLGNLVLRWSISICNGLYWQPPSAEFAVRLWTCGYLCKHQVLNSYLDLSLILEYFMHADTGAGRPRQCLYIVYIKKSFSYFKKGASPLLGLTLLHPPVLLVRLVSWWLFPFWRGWSARNLAAHCQMTKALIHHGN